MDDTIQCTKDCIVISGDGITQSEIKKLKDLLGLKTFNELNKIKMQIEGKVSKNNTIYNNLMYILGALYYFAFI